LEKFAEILIMREVLRDRESAMKYPFLILFFSVLFAALVLMTLARVVRTELEILLQRERGRYSGDGSNDERTVHFPR
jgi:hypothetical protein